MFPDFEFEKEIISRGYALIAGVDEVGRGALAGPIVSAAVIFDLDKDIKVRIIDSKKLDGRKRSDLNRYILENSLDYGIGSVSNEEIDKIGIGQANILSFSRALSNLKKVDFALIDGRRFRGFDYKYRCLVRGESKSISIAAASIVAKVHRDRIMEELCDEKYQFRANKGYGTKDHVNLLKTHGPSEHHRRSFLKGILSNQSELLITKTKKP
jgi:ribonuclease HII